MLNDFYKQFKSGTDIRGIASEGVEGEALNMTNDAIKAMTGGFCLWLCEKTGKNATDLTVSVGRDSRISGERIASVVFNVNGANYTATLSDGKWTASIPGLDTGEYTVKATITDIYENVAEKTQKITVAVASDPIQITEVNMGDYKGKAWDIVIDDFDGANTYAATFTDGEDAKSGEIDFSNAEADDGSIAFAIFLHTSRANVTLDIATE